MTTLEQLQALSDEALIEKVAVEVMRWTRGPIPDSLSNTEWWWKNGEPIYVVPGKGKNKALRWNPLTDWNHTWEVVEKMQSEYIDFTLHHEPGFGLGGWEVWFGNIEQFYGEPHGARTEHPKRAICLAALLAISSSHVIDHLQ